ncbi:DUF1289 domain-containing protein [Thalassotalea sediminis]|uniref:DUF1289 domain-containing protein n=1 Tax=Thalassotalea sediminis TaxID=1759089 RepID=UPI0025742D49|nr:DUF1289 domain-containing protein [Thalassotalea sediminis]
MKIDSKTLSPCIRKCCLNDVDICLGCGRHVDEIVSWSKYTNEQKYQVLDRCAQWVHSNKSNNTQTRNN